MDTFEEGIRFVKYFVDEADAYRIHIYYNDFEEKKIEEEMLNDNQIPSERYYLKDRVSEFVGEESSYHIFYERKRFFAINADGSSHHFRLGLALPDVIIRHFIKKYKNFKLMENRKLETGMQNKVFYIELIIKENIKKNVKQ
jgi:hypothetical protein